MKTPGAAFSLKKSLPAAAVLPAAAASLAVYAAAIFMAGGSVFGLFLYAAIFGLFIVAPGFILCGLLLPGTHGSARLVLALPLGAALLVCGFVPSGALGLPLLAFIPGGLLTLFFAARIAVRRPAFLPLRIEKPWWGLAGLYAALMFLAAFAVVFTFARPLAAGNMVYSQDMLWTVGNASAVRYGFPLRDLRTAGGVLHYHYFTEVVTGLVALLGRLRVFDAVCYYTWPIWCAWLLLALYTLARRFGCKGWQALTIPFGACLGTFLYRDMFTHLFQNPNNVLQSNTLLLAAILSLYEIRKNGRVGAFRGYAAFCLVCAALVWSKATVGVLFVCGLAAAIAVHSAVRRRLSVWDAAPLLIGAAVVGLLYKTLFSGAIINLVFAPSPKALESGITILIFSFTPAFIIYLFSLFQALRHFSALSFYDLLLHAMVAGGFAAFVLFYHYSRSQAYFLLTSCFLMWLCAARVLPRLLIGRPLKMFCAFLGAAALAGVLVSAAPAGRFGVQTALRCAQLRPMFPETPQTATPQDEKAAEWLRANMGPNEVFATNRNAQDSALGDGIFHLYTAFSERQAYVESWRYAMDYSMDYHRLIHQLENVSDAIFEARRFDDAAQIARQNGIDYLLVYLPLKPVPFEGAQPVFSEGGVAIYRVN